MLSTSLRSSPKSIVQLYVSGFLVVGICDALTFSRLIALKAAAENIVNIETVNSEFRQCLHKTVNTKFMHLHFNHPA